MAYQYDPTSMLFQDYDPNGNMFNPSMIGQQVLPAAQTVQGGFDPAFDSKYVAAANGFNDQIGNAYNYNVSPAAAATFNPLDVPQPGASQFQAAQFTNPAQASAAQAGLTQFNNPSLANVAQYSNPQLANAQSFAYSPELQRMFSGQGFDPATLAALKASSMEQLGGAGTQQMAAARRALSQAGLDGSLAGAGVESDVARQVGQAQSGALRDIDIQNALTGMENYRQGLGYQTQIGLANTNAQNALSQFNAGQTNQVGLANMAAQNQGNQYNAGVQNTVGLANANAANQNAMFNAGAQNDISQFNAGQLNNIGLQNAGMQNQVGLSNMEQANQMALANASRLFSAMSQNQANQQQANMATFGQQADQAANKANALGNAWNQQGQAYNQAALGKQTNADIFNSDAANQFKLQQAQLDRNAAAQNQSVQENRWQTGMGMSGAGYNPLLA